MHLTLNDIRDAAAMLPGHAVRTPLVRATQFEDEIGATLWLKLENMQDISAFKQRGAYIKLAGLSAEERKAGVIAMSAGNHAQGVAYHAKRLGIPATIVMPEGTPFSKVERTRMLGAKVVLRGKTIDESGAHASKLREEQGQVFVHPYDDPAIIQGQGTVALEMLEDQPELDMLVVPIGGGGLISGMAIAAKALNPKIEIVGVESELYPSMYQTLNGLPPKCGGDTIADGIAVKNAGKLTAEIVRDLVSDIVLVDEASLERAVQLLLERSKLVSEGAGAAGLAAILASPERFAGRRLGVPICGGNIDSRLLASVLMRGLVRDGRIVSLRIEITDQPGVLARIAGLIGDQGGNIVEISHQRMLYDVPVKHAELGVMVETRNADHVDAILNDLRDAGFAPAVRGMTSV